MCIVSECFTIHAVLPFVVVVISAGAGYQYYSNPY